MLGRFLKNKKDLTESAKKLAEKSNSSISDAKKTLKKAKASYGISYKEFIKFKLYELDESEWVQTFSEKKADKESVKARKEFKSSFTYSELEEKTDSGAHIYDSAMRYAEAFEKTYPDGVAAASAYLGCRIPTDADPIYRPSAYVHLDKCDIGFIRECLGEQCLPDTETFKTEFRKFKRKYDSLKVDHNSTDLAIYYTDFIMHCKDAGFAPTDYFDFRLYLRNASSRLEFLSDTGFKRYVRRICNKDLSVFKDKRSFNTFLDQLISRDWLDLVASDYEDFKAFVSKHPVFFAKPAEGTGGVDAVKIDSRETSDLKELYDNCVKNELILEECVKQHADMAEFNKDSLNTIRVYTLVDADGISRILGAIARFGREGKVVDNFHQGGVCAVVDVETGQIITDAMDIYSEYFEIHPDSKKVFKGSSIPEWDEVTKTVKEAAVRCAEINRHAGWDVAITENGKAEIIEANSTPNFDILQSIDQIGKRKLYEKYLTPLAQKAGIKIYNPKMSIPKEFKNPKVIK